MTEHNTLPLIIEPEQLARHLDDPKLLIIDVPARADSYREGHVPGALFLDHTRLLRGEGPVANDVPTEAQLSELWSSLGLTEQTHVIAYDDEGGGWAGRLLWTLELLGHAHYSYLNGGIQAWRSDNLPLSTDDVAPQPSDYHAEIRHPHMLMTREELQSRLEDTGLAIWDARSAEEYAGLKGQNRHLGHIPGAVNFDWLDVMDRSNGARLRDLSELLTELNARGITAEHEIVTHCQSHHRSGLTWLAGRALGFNIRAYPGSWQEWGNRDDTPVEH